MLSLSLRTALPLIIATLCTALTPARASAEQIFRLGRWSGLAEFGYDQTEETLTAVDDGATRPLFERSRFEQKVGLRNRLTVLDPSVLVVHYGLTLGFLQNDFSSDRGESAGDGRLTGYDLTAGFFPQRRFSLDLLANRYESLVPQEFAGTLEINSQSYGATFKMRRIFLPGSLSYRHSDISTGTSADPLNRGRDEQRRSLQYLAARDWKGHRLQVSSEYAELDDRLFSSVDHTRYRGSIHHTYELPGVVVGGPADDPVLRSPGTLTSRISYSDRSGNFGASSFDWRESLRLRHREKVFSTLTYQLRRFETVAGQSQTERAAFSYRHDLYESLETETRVELRRVDFDTGRSDVFDSRFDVEYTKRIPGGQLRLGLDLGYETQDDAFDLGETFVSRESHVARFGEPFRLDRPQALLESLLIVDASGSTIFLEGIDYTASLVGLFVEVRTIPGGGIGDGDTVLVDYRIEIGSQTEFETVTTTTRAALDFGWFEPFATWQRRDERILSGQDIGVLDDLSLESHGVQLRWRRPRWSFTSRAERRMRRSRLLEYEEENLSGQLTLKPHRAWTATVTANHQSTDFTLPTRETRLGALRVHIGWRPHPGLSLEAFGGERVWRDSLSLSEDFENAGLRARCKVGRLELVGTLSEWTRRRNGDEFESLRATVGITRRFLPGSPPSNTAPRGRSGPWIGDLPVAAPGAP